MKYLRRHLAAATLLSVSGTALADPASWTCSSCPDTSGWQLLFDAGPAFTTGSDYRFGNITGLDSSGASLFGDVYARFRADKADYVEIDGYLRGESSFGLFAKGGRQGLYKVTASYQAIPQRLQGDTLSPYSGQADLVLPASWVPASSTGGMTALAETSSRTPLGADFEAFKLGVDFKIARAWNAGLHFTRRTEQGKRSLGGSFFFNSALLPAPVDYVTSNIDANVRFKGDGWQAQVAYLASTFENENEALRWDNAYSIPTGVTEGQSALAPDNELHRLSASGVMKLPMSTVVNGLLSVGRSKQNASLLEYTTNPGIPTQPLPVTNANAEVDTTNLNLRAVMSHWDKLSLEGRLQFYDHNNRTARNSFDYVITDAAPSGVSVTNTAYDFSRRELKLRADYRPWRFLSLDAGVGFRSMDRDLQERERTDTGKIWVGLQARKRDMFTIEVDLLGEDRDGSTYTAIENPVAQQNPLMRKYNMADRERSAFRFRASLFSWENIDVGLEYFDSTDRYPSSEIGLTGSDTERFSLDANWIVTPKISTYLSASTENTDIDQANSQSFSQPDWTATTKDRFNTALLGYRHSQMFEQVDVVFEYGWNRAIGEINSDTSGLQSSFPDLKSTRQTLRLGVIWPYSDRWQFGADYFYERLETDDWALDGVAQDTVSSLLTMGAMSWNYSNSVFYLNARFQYE